GASIPFMGFASSAMLTYVAGALHQSKIPASPELAKASTRQHVNDRATASLKLTFHLDHSVGANHERATTSSAQKRGSRPISAMGAAPPFNLGNMLRLPTARLKPKRSCGPRRALIPRLQKLGTIFPTC